MVTEEGDGITRGGRWGVNAFEIGKALDLIGEIIGPITSGDTEVQLEKRSRTSTSICGIIIIRCGEGSREGESLARFENANLHSETKACSDHTLALMRS